MEGHYRPSFWECQIKKIRTDKWYDAPCSQNITLFTLFHQLKHLPLQKSYLSKCNGSTKYWIFTCNFEYAIKPLRVWQGWRCEGVTSTLLRIKRIIWAALLPILPPNSCSALHKFYQGTQPRSRWQSCVPHRLSKNFSLIPVILDCISNIFNSQGPKTLCLNETNWFVPCKSEGTATVFTIYVPLSQLQNSCLTLW